MSTFIFILLGLGGVSILCAILIISAVITASRASKRVAGNQLRDLAEEAQALQRFQTATAPKQQSKSSTTVTLP